MDEERTLHISYPRAKLVPTLLFTHRQRSPLVLRAHLSQEEKDIFVDNLK